MTPSGSQVGVFGRDLAAGPGRADHVVRGARRSGRGQVAAGLGRIHAVVADSGYHRAGSYWTRPDRGWLAELGLPAGHRGLPPETERLVDQAIREQLATYPGREVVGVSNLADGADQIFARAVLDAGGKLEVIVPAARYRDGLPESAHAAYDALLSRACGVHRLDRIESDEQAHMEASRTMLDRADHLFAVWDGQPARGYGGTADVVAEARNRGIPVTVIWPDGASRDQAA